MNTTAISARIQTITAATAQQSVHTAAFARLPGRRNRATGWLSIAGGSLSFHGLRGRGDVTIPLRQGVAVSAKSIFGLLNYGFTVKTPTGEAYSFEPLDSSGSILSIVRSIRSIVAGDAAAPG